DHLDDVAFEGLGDGERTGRLAWCVPADVVGIEPRERGERLQGIARRRRAGKAQRPLFTVVEQFGATPFELGADVATATPAPGDRDGKSARERCSRRPREPRWPAPRGSGPER